MKHPILKAVIPYVEGSGNKPRPVIQLNSPCDEHKNFQVVYITSQKPDGNYPTDIEVEQKHKDFSLTGLNKNSYIRASKIFTIDPSMVELVLGDLPEDLTIKLNNVLKTSLKLY